VRRDDLFDHFFAIAQDSALLVLIRVLGMFLGLALMIMLARVLTPAEFGAVAIAFSVALIGGLLTTLNIGAGALRFLTTYAVAGDRGSAAAYERFGHALVIKSGLLIWSVLLATILIGQAWSLLPDVPWYIFAGAATAPLFGWLRIRAANLTALGPVVLALTPHTVLRPLLMLAMVSGSLAILGYLDERVVLTSYFIAALAACFSQQSLFRRHSFATSVPPSVIKSETRRKWVRIGFDLLIPTLFLDLTVDTIIIVSSMILGSEDIAILAIVLRVQAVILFGVTSINMVIGPRISKAHNSGDHRAVNHLLSAAAHLKLWPSLVVFGLLGIFGQTILSIFGPEYSSHLAPLMVLSIAPLAMAIFGPVVLFATILGLQSEANQVFQLAIALLVVLVLALGHFFGVIGVAVAVVVVTIFWHVRLNSIVRQSCDYRLLQPDFLHVLKNG